MTPLELGHRMKVAEKLVMPHISEDMQPLYRDVVMRTHAIYNGLLAARTEMNKQEPIRLVADNEGVR